MKKLLVSAAFVAVVSTNSLANELVRETCKDMERTATTVMEVRQGGLEMSETMAWAGDKTGIQKMVRSAYRQPQVVGAKLRQQIATEFGNKWYAWCLDRWVTPKEGAVKPAPPE